MSLRPTDREMAEYYAKREDDGSQIPVFVLERTLAREDVLLQRLRTIAQLLIEEVGADGPMSTEEAAERAVALIKEQKRRLKSLQKEIDDANETMAGWNE